MRKQFTKIALAAALGLALAFALGCEEKSSDKTKAEAETAKAADTPKPSENATDTLVYNWDWDLCAYTGYYLSSQYSKETVENIHKLWELRRRSMFNENPMVFKPEDIEKVDLQKFTNEYQNIIKLLDDRYKSISIPFWKNYIAELKSTAQKGYYSEKMEFEAFENPKILLSNEYPYSNCEYAKILASGDTTLILEAWEKFVKEKYSNSPLIIEEFPQKYNSPDKYRWAQIDLLGGMGYYCTRAKYTKQQKEEEDDKYDKYTKQVDEEYKKIFVKINEECQSDEP